MGLKGTSRLRFALPKPRRPTPPAIFQTVSGIRILRTSQARSSRKFCQREGAPSSRMKIVEGAGCSRLLRGLWLPFIGSTAAIEALQIPQQPLAFFGILLE